MSKPLQGIHHPLFVPRLPLSFVFLRELRVPSEILEDEFLPGITERSLSDLGLRLRETGVVQKRHKFPF